MLAAGDVEMVVFTVEIALLVLRFVSNIILTHTNVANKEAFSKNADLWAQYLGAEPPASAVETRQSTNPDVLVEIQAVALLK